MSIKDLTITDQTVQGIYVQSQPDRLTGTAQQNKAVFDAYPALIKQRFNQLIELLTAESGAGEIPVRPIEGVTAENVQQALAAIQQNLTAYINKLKATAGAAEVGVSTISGISAGNVQQALEGLRAIQITLDSNIQKLMSANGAAAVGVSKISGMQAQNVQKALEELRKAIDDSVSGIIPGGSITADMLEGPIPPEKGGTGAETTQNAVENLGAAVQSSIIDNAIFIGGYGEFKLPINQRGKSVYICDSDTNVLDRWKASNCTLKISESGIELQKKLGSDFLLFYQLVQNQEINKMTLSIIFDGEVYSGSDNFEDIESIAISLPGNPINRAELIKSGSILLVRIIIADELPHVIAGIKIEKGKNQTLGYQDDNGKVHLITQMDGEYLLQLLRCQQYFQLYSSAEERPSKAVDCRPVMRIDPTPGTIQIGEKTYYYNSAEL